MKKLAVIKKVGFAVLLLSGIGTIKASDRTGIPRL